MSKQKRLFKNLIEYRFLFAFLTVVIFLLVYGSVALAAEGNIGQNGNDATIETDLGDFFSTTNPQDMIVDPSRRQTAYSSETGGNFSNVNINGFWNRVYNYINRATIVRSVTVNGETINFDDSSYFLMAYMSINSNVYSISIDSPGHVMITNADNRTALAIVSDQPMSIGYVINYTSTGTFSTVGSGIFNQPDENGFYKWVLTGTDFYCIATNAPVYLPSTDGKSGYVQQNLSDFSFDNDNFNFNNLLVDGIVIEPSGGDDPFENDKYYLNFYDTSFYGGGALTSFFHVNNFNFNQHILQNPINYRIRFDYRAEVSYNGNNYVYTYSPSDLQLSYFLGQVNRIGSGNKIAVPLSSDWFFDGNGHTLSSMLKGTVYDVEGTTSSFSSPNDILESDSEVVLDPIFLFRLDEYVKKELPKVNRSYTFDKFMIYGSVTLYTDSDSSYESFSYRDSYNFLNGNTSVESTDNVNPPYTDEFLPPSTINPENQTNSVTYGSGSVNPTINVTVNNSGNGGFVPFQLSEVSYANVKGMLDDILDFVDSTSENSFWAVLARTFSFIPAKIWEYITITIAVICGFAIVRYVLRR